MTRRLGDQYPAAVTRDEARDLYRGILAAGLAAPAVLIAYATALYLGLIPVGLS